MQRTELTAEQELNMAIEVIGFLKEKSRSSGLLIRPEILLLALAALKEECSPFVSNEFNASL